MKECPHHGPVKPATYTGLWVLLLVLGFVTCGLTWLLTPFLVLAKIFAPACPICGAALQASK